MTSSVGARINKGFLLWMLFSFACAMLIPAIVASREGLALLARIPLWTALLLALIVLFAWVLRALVTLLLVQPLLDFKIPFLRLLMLELVVNFFFISTPLGVGGVIAAAALVKSYGISLHRVVAISIFSKFIDAFFLVFLLLVTSLVASRYLATVPFGSAITTITTLGAFALIFIWGGLVFFVFRPRAVLAGLIVLCNLLRVKRKNSNALVFFLLRVKRSVEIFSGIVWWRKLLVGLAAAAYWLAASATLWVSVIAVGGYISWDSAVAVQVISAIPGKVVVLPGGAVVSEITAIGLLIPAGGAAMAGASILLWRLMAFYLPLLLGVLSFFILSRKRDGAATRGEGAHRNLQG